ncbi:MULTISPECIES: DUF2058 domain-containing protein [unclassified Luteimonas]|uniref:DUF2058 domain-containing protein n=1 Tax=unclassified Luteimonas TaxID=2629088 RepID=UPI0015FF6DA5|nr:MULTISPECIES: DUF2058 domain-containing protein [unclassified Luteimonas]MBB1471730.1 DUF2058 domain-containing protein [Luteimonas sp. MC1782]MBB6599527.1 DUF2058 domain-containing protein [Luteimonas sp. MC1825]QOC87224.1 DUF2058 domain-containing protein [Luteimonas sp. MC1825]
MRNPLQEQLLKAGLAKKSRVDQVAREQTRQRHAKSPPPADEGKAALERARLDKIERDRALSAERNEQARAQELRAQVRQIVEQNRLAVDGTIDYRFTHAGAIRTLPVTDAVRRQLAAGSLVVACHDGGYAIIPRAAAEKVGARDPAMIALDHARSAPPQSDAADDDWYSRFKVPDDLVW